MSNIFDYPRFSTFVNSIVNRKMRTISQSITSSTGYFMQLITDAAASAAAALSSENKAKTSENNTTATWQSFTSLYLGVNVNDPVKSALGRNITPGAFHVKQGNQRLRVAVSVANDGTPTWMDAQVRADYDTVVEAGDNVFLFLHKSNLQVVDGPVAFNGKTTVPGMTDYDSNEVTNGKSMINYVESRIHLYFPIGTISLFYGENAPYGWARCDGGTYPRIDGLGTITTPDMRDRVAVGAGNQYGVGTAFGNNTVNVTTNSNTTGITASVTQDPVDAGGGANRLKTVTLNDPGHTHAIENIDVRQPAVALWYIMRI